MDESAEQLVSTAINSEHEDYLQAEAQLFRNPGQAAEAAALAQEEAGPAGELLAAVLSDAEAHPDRIPRARAYLDRLERKYARSVAIHPPLEGVVQTLSEGYGPLIAPFMALRLMKQPLTTDWQSTVALAFLERHPSPLATEALVHFAAVTQDEDLRTRAVRLITMIDDPDLTSKLQRARDRLATRGIALPTAVVALSNHPA